MLTPFSYEIVYIMIEVGGLFTAELFEGQKLCMYCIKALSFILNFEGFLGENQGLIFDLFLFICLSK